MPSPGWVPGCDIHDRLDVDEARPSVRAVEVRLRLTAISAESAAWRRSTL